MKKLLPLALLLSTSAFANFHLAPPDFETKGGMATFVDIQKAEYNITFDVEESMATVKSRIVFNNRVKGLPIFDLIPSPTKVKLDGVSVKTPERKDPFGSKMRVVDFETPVGTHVLEMENRITRNVSFPQNLETVRAAFWIRDLKDRMFLEQYIPSNYEFDQYQMTFNVEIKGSRKLNYDFFVNGEITQTSPSTWKIVYPEYFTVSALYFHMAPKSSYRVLKEEYTSVSGRKFTITTYSDYIWKTSKFMKYAKEVMAELEADYGPWAHPSLVAYQTMPGGGMEHSGAAQTSLGALDHEMLHSYFAKGVMPGRGDDGWIDEAIASWRDYGYQRLPSVSFDHSNLGNHSPYKRNTDDRCYELGRAFMAYLDYRLQDMGGLKAFLRGYFAAYKHTIWTTQHFKNNLEFFSGLNFDDEFNRYILSNDEGDSHAGPNPFHQPHTEKELHDML
ncbi:MAG: hypothetical protein ACJ76H_14915 [Bacteriovoracaceae bacterium]